MIDLIKVGNTIADRYKLLVKISSSTFDSTFLTNDVKTNTQQIIKFVNFNNFGSEADLNILKKQLNKAQMFNFSNIIRVYNFGEYLEYNYFAYEYVKGISLRHLINYYKELNFTFNSKEVKFLINTLIKILLLNDVEGFYYYLKPEHIILTNHSIKISGLSLGNLTQFNNPAIQLENDDIPYTANELLTRHGIKPESNHSIIYSLAAILYELLTFEIPGKDFFIFSDKLDNLEQGYRLLLISTLTAFPENRLEDIREFRSLLNNVPSKEFSGSRMRAFDTAFSLIQTMDWNSFESKFEHPVDKYYLKNNNSHVSYFDMEIWKEPISDLSKEKFFPVGSGFDLEERTRVTSEDQLQTSLEIIRQAQRVNRSKSKFSGS